MLDAARAWLRSAPVTTAATLSPPPVTALQIAFTAPGMEALDVSAAVRAGFSSEFLDGMDDSSRARRLGDVESNAPEQWDWGYAPAVPHVLVMLFAKPGQLDDWVREYARGRMARGVRRDAAADHESPGWRRAVRLHGRHQPARGRLGAAARSVKRRETDMATRLRLASSSSDIATSTGSTPIGH